MITSHEIEKTVGQARRHTLGDLLARTRERKPNKLAIIYGNQKLTYKELDDTVNQTAHAFIDDGMGKGDMIAIMSKNSLEFVVAEFALARIGAVMIPINYMLSNDDVQYILKHAKVSGLIASTEYTSVLDQSTDRLEIAHRFVTDAPPTKSKHTWVPLVDARMGKNQDFIAEIEIEDDDLAHVLYTSGTESKPKGVMLSHKSIINEYVSCIVDGNIESSDVTIQAMPLYHSAQLHVFLGPGIYVGATCIILEAAKPDMILETIEEKGASQLFCPPTVWIGMLRSPEFDERDLASLEKCYYGAASMPREVLKELSERLPNARFWNFYGQTEVAPLATALQPDDQLRKLGSAGVPSLNVQTKIVDNNDVEMPRGEIGEIVHRTPHAMKGYLHDPEKTAEVFRNGWFHSGDLGIMDEEGYITIVDRKKDMINTGGVNVSSREVEETVYEMAAISEVAVISVPDPYWIEAIMAIIVPKPNAALEKEKVIEFCKSKLAKYKAPKFIEITDELPKNPSGKVLKRDLRDLYKETTK